MNRKINTLAPLALLLSGSPAFAESDIQAAVAELKEVYAIDAKALSAPPEDDQGYSADALLVKHKLITDSLLKHIEKVGGLDFDMLTSSQDWDMSWGIKVGAPVKSGKNYDVAVLLDRKTEKTTVTWKFIEQNGAWLIDDASYAEPEEKPFTLRSLKEGD